MVSILVLRKTILDHMIRAVDDTSALSDPFPHCIVSHFFPDSVYAELLACLPGPTQYEVFGYEKHMTSDGQSNRRRFQLSNSNLDLLTERQRILWMAVRSALGSHELKQHMFNKLLDGLAYRYGCDL